MLRHLLAIALLATGCGAPANQRTPEAPRAVPLAADNNSTPEGQEPVVDQHPEVERLCREPNAPYAQCGPQGGDPIEILYHLKVAEPITEGYDRKAWKHWTDDDHDCQDTRQEVLIAESEEPVTFKTAKQCKVAAGKWTCPYTGEVFTNPRKLDVDHFIPLGAAHEAGGNAWDKVRRRAFANELKDHAHLVAVKASANRSKGKRGPDAWLPALEGYRCEYVSIWVRLKKEWELTVSAQEATDIEMQLRACAQGEEPQVPSKID